MTTAAPGDLTPRHCHCAKRAHNSCTLLCKLRLSVNAAVALLDLGAVLAGFSWMQGGSTILSVYNTLLSNYNQEREAALSTLGFRPQITRRAFQRPDLVGAPEGGERITSQVSPNSVRTSPTTPLCCPHARWRHQDFVNVTLARTLLRRMSWRRPEARRAVSLSVAACLGK